MVGKAFDRLLFIMTEGLIDVWRSAINTAWEICINLGVLFSVFVLPNC